MTQKSSFTAWALFAAGVSTLAIVVRKLRRSRSAADLGSVSAEWVMEHRWLPDSRQY